MTDKVLPYFVYLDSKIVGSAQQICTFFDNGVFDKQSTCVLIKEYKHKSNQIIGQIFKKANITHRFVLAGDLDGLERGVIFYPFNAQSNVRAVANRNLTHIFITHGESSKMASIKPIIRVYDYVITAGQAGIDRYLKNGIFSPYDVESGRIIALGDTFVGKTGLSSNRWGNNVIFYAPTWEGGIERENYSSLAFVGKVARTLIQAANQYQVDTIVIKPHPNTGYRLSEYLNYLYELAKQLKDNQLKVVIFKPNLTLSFLQRLKYQRLGIKLVGRLDKYYAKIGFCDISAMETQFLNENIPYYLFCQDKDNTGFLNKQHYYKNSLIDLKSNNVVLKTISSDDFNELKLYTIQQSINRIAINERIAFLLNKLT